MKIVKNVNSIKQIVYRKLSITVIPDKARLR